MISILSDVDSEEFEYYRICGKHYDEFMTRYYDNERNSNNIRSIIISVTREVHQISENYGS